MPIVTCAVDGCRRKLHPICKPDRKDRETWLYRECDRCFKPLCEHHCSELRGQCLCHDCRGALERECHRIPLLHWLGRPVSGYELN